MKILLSTLSAVALSAGSVCCVAENALATNSNNAYIDSLQYHPKMTAKLASELENTQFAHSDWNPTGLFVKPNTKLNYKITINNPSKPIDQISDPFIAIGFCGSFEKTLDYKGEPQIINLSFAQLTGQVVSTQLGLVFTTYFLDNDAKIEVSLADEKDQTGMNVNMFSLNDNSKSFLKKLVSERLEQDNYFFTILKSKHTYEIVQTANLQKELKKHPRKMNINLNNVLNYFDLNFKYSNENYGLDKNYQGVAKEYDYPIAYWNSDYVGGYMYATQNYISLQGDAAIDEILDENFLTGSKTPDWWGIWHETGHTFQNDAYKMSWWVEVTVNLNSYWNALKIVPNAPESVNWIKKFYFGPDHIEIAGIVKDYFNQVAAKKMDLTDKNNVLSDYFEKNYSHNQLLNLGLLFWIQMFNAFGAQFFPTLSQYYRTEIGTNYSDSNDQKLDLLARAISKVTNINMTKFFETWGVPLSKQTLNLMNSYGADNSAKILDNGLERDFYHSYLDRHAVHYIGNYKSKLISSYPNNISQTNNSQLEINRLLVLNQENNFSNKLFNKYTKTYEPELVNNKFALKLNQTDLPDNVILFSGYYDRLTMGLYVNDNNDLQIFGTNYEIHSAYKNELYYAFQILDQSDNIIRTIKVTGFDSGLDIIKGLKNTLAIKNGYKIKVFGQEGDRVWINNHLKTNYKYQQLTNFVGSNSRVKVNAEIEFIHNKLVVTSADIWSDGVPDWLRG